MNKQLEHLNNLNGTLALIDVDDFYTISFTEDDISLQGKMTSAKLAKYHELFNFTTDGEDGFLRAETRICDVRVRITLT